ncbi:MAG TPA: 30S ribosome-binding factor RbfA [Rhodothermales bacterium]|jgi:ribosome-binding factor A
MSIRTERVSRLVQREIAQILQSFQDVAPGMFTVTGARVNRDLSIAYVHVSSLGDSPEQRMNAFKRLEELTPRLRSELASRIRHQVRHIPEIRLMLDDSLNHAARIEELLTAARKERAGREAAEDAEIDAAAEPDPATEK